MLSTSRAVWTGVPSLSKARGETESQCPSPLSQWPWRAGPPHLCRCHLVVMAAGAELTCQGSGGGWECPRELLQPIRPAPLQLLSCLTEEKWGCAKGHAGHWSPALAGEAAIMAGFVKIGIRKKTQTLFSGAEVVSTAEGHREELSCAHTHLFLFSGLCLNREQL